MDPDRGAFADSRALGQTSLDSNPGQTTEVHLTQPHLPLQQHAVERHRRQARQGTRGQQLDGKWCMCAGPNVRDRRFARQLAFGVRVSCIRLHALICCRGYEWSWMGLDSLASAVGEQELNLSMRLHVIETGLNICALRSTTRPLGLCRSHCFTIAMVAATLSDALRLHMS